MYQKQHNFTLPTFSSYILKYEATENPSQTAKTNIYSREKPNNIKFRYNDTSTRQ
jgi:hypothetical protein